METETGVVMDGDKAEHVRNCPARLPNNSRTWNMDTIDEVAKRNGNILIKTTDTVCP